MRKEKRLFFIFLFLFYSMGFSQEKGISSSDKKTSEEVDEEKIIEEAREIKGNIEKYFRDSNNRLKIFDYDDGSFSFTESQDSFESVIVNSDEFSRTKYNSDYRPVERIVWKNSASLSESKIILRKKWQYEEDEIFSEEEDFEAKKFYEIRYNKKELPFETKEYDFDSESDEKVLVKKSLVSYDEERHPLIVEDEFFKKTGGATEETEPIYIRKSIYSYTENSETPDLLFYEDGNLRFSLEHIDEDICIETIYFADGIYVSSKFKDGVKIEENIHK